MFEDFSVEVCRNLGLHGNKGGRKRIYGGFLDFGQSLDRERERKRQIWPYIKGQNVAF